MATDAAGVVEKGDEFGLGVSVRGADVGPDEGVGLPHLVRMRLGEREATLGFVRGLWREEPVRLHDTAEGVGGDLGALEQPVLDADAVEGGDVADVAGLLVAEVTSCLLDNLGDLFEGHLARDTAIAPRPRMYGGDSVLLVA